MIFLTLLIVLFFCLASVSAAGLNGTDDVKVLKSNDASGNLTAKTASLGTADKVQTNKTKTIKTNTTTKKTNTSKANVTTVNKKTLAKTSTSFMNSVEKNGKFPKVRISNKNYSNTEYLYLISKSVENDSNSKIEINKNLVKPYTNTKHKSVKGTINKTEYVNVAKKTRVFIEKNHRAPNWASCSKGNIPYNQLILLFSKCMDTYNKTGKMPNSVKLDDLDLDLIKNKIKNKNAKSTTATVKKTNGTKASAAKKTNTTKTSASKKTSTKKTNTTKTSTAKKTNTTKTSTSKTSTNPSKTAEKNTVESSLENAKGSLVEISMNYVNNILNSILDRLDPSKFQVDLSKNAEANAKFNTSKVNVDVNGKSTLNVKISAKDSKNTTKTKKKTKTTKTSTAKKTSTKKTIALKAIKINTKKASAKKTKTTKTSASKKTTNKKTSNKTVSKTSIPQSLKQYLAATKNCQVNNKEIKDLAKKLTSSLKSNESKGKKIFNWVRDNIQYEKYSNTKKGAKNTLKKKGGNCVDQSHLLIALSRAAGIPAKYVNGGNCKFSSGYVSGHVWTKMYINKKWIVADPTSSRNTLGKIRNWNTKSYTLYGEYSSINF